MQEFVYILCHSLPAIVKIKLTEEDQTIDNAEELLHKYGYHADECSYMFTEQDLEIQDDSE